MRTYLFLRANQLFSLTTKSHSVSVTKDADDFDPYDYIDAEDAAAELAYVQYSKSLIFGNTKSKSSHQGDSFNESEGPWNIIFEEFTGYVDQRV